MQSCQIKRRHFLAGAAALGLAGARPFAARAAQATGQEAIISIGGSVSEIVVALGRHDRLVAVDTTSRFPEKLTKLPQLGYMRNLAAEGILSLNPTHIIASEHAGPATTMAQLRETGVLSVIPDQPSPDGLADKILKVGQALDIEEKARILAKTVRSDFVETRDRIKETLARTGADRPRVAFLHNIGQASPLASGRDTAAHTMISLAGGTNAFNSFISHKTVSPEALIQAAPDILIMGGRSIERFGGMDSLRALPHVAATPAGKNRRIFTVDTLYTLGFGPRSGHALAELTNRFHPTLNIPVPPARPWLDGLS
ncbi:heme/hemin ABC transporter substrate-binding protein [Aestuariispira insulae]|uniref:Iron complex transport system substrate-binding protein n=1 Tax=Aestuariispira insulae TaxID=1461337 RepID=A0A3D9H3U2_9PROT|nr:ABC transporter substrate-binding protein [Aestuariispira insulae]RED44165.1 iron complex transport system substrate-binding protein [Aestuariispira insulae]